MGGTTVAFDVATRLVPWLIDLAVLRLGYEGQMTDDVEALRLCDPTLAEPSGAPGGVRGPFDAGARRFSVQIWVMRHPAAYALALAALAAAALAAGLALH